jgi:nucleoside-diphosphate-sugar epimerase
MTVYICGASGYIGSNLLAMYPKCVPMPRKEFPFTREGDAVINLAAYGHHPGQDDVDEMVRVNVLHPTSLYRSLAPGVRLVHACSSSERDDPGLPYSKSKSMATYYLLRKASLAVIYSVFGGLNMHPHYFLNALILKARTGGDFHVSCPASFRDYLHVRHVCKCLMDMALNPYPYAECHIGSGRSMFFDAIAQKAAAMSPHELVVTRGIEKGKGYYPAPASSIHPIALWAKFDEDLKGEICG